jgi:hypothetical protein
MWFASPEPPVEGMASSPCYGVADVVPTSLQGFVGYDTTQRGVSYWYSESVAAIDFYVRPSYRHQMLVSTL